MCDSGIMKADIEKMKDLLPRMRYENYQDI